MTTLNTLLPHENEYGLARAKEPGDVYEAPDQVAQALIANGYVEMLVVDEPTTTD